MGNQRTRSNQHAFDHMGLLTGRESNGALVAAMFVM
jgi:hypothetical protein